jgi:dihydropteroate synthase
MPRPGLVGILNVTPDSFSDGGAFLEPDRALAHARELLEAGADVIDVGAESTRPGATPIDPDEEWRRLERVLPELCRMRDQSGRFLISLDTRHASTLQRALPLGIDWINDVGGMRDAKMIELAAGSKARVVLMHSLTVPASPHEILSPDCDPCAVLLEWGERRASELQIAGIARDRIIFDPGVGFGKSASQSRLILDDIERLHALGLPLLVGHSRKSFIGGDDRDATTLRFSAALAERGVQYLRVHDVSSHARMFVI